MNTQTKSQIPPRRLGRSILAVLAGIAVGIVLFVGTDWGLHLIGLVPAPAQNERWPNQLLLLATVYRSIYGVIASYVIARLAPNRPMGHALLAGALGTLVCILAAFVTWSSTIGQHWYSVALLLTAIPTAWIGAKLRLMQLRTDATAGQGKMREEL
jgi:amino acid transporter